MSGLTYYELAEERAWARWAQSQFDADRQREWEADMHAEWQEFVDDFESYEATD